MGREVDIFFLDITADLDRLQRAWERDLAMSPSEIPTWRAVLQLIEEELHDGRHGDKLVAKAKLEFAKYE